MSKSNTKKYENKVKNLKYIQIVLVIVCLGLFSAYLYYVTRPTLTNHNIEDECGPIGGSISHSIDDEDACKNVCNAYCQSIDQIYHGSEFSLGLNECNTCECTCEK